MKKVLAALGKVSPWKDTDTLIYNSSLALVWELFLTTTWNGTCQNLHILYELWRLGNNCPPLHAWRTDSTQTALGFFSLHLWNKATQSFVTKLNT